MPLSTYIKPSDANISNDEPQILLAMGIHGQNLFVDAANRMVIAKVSSQDDRIDNRALWMTHKAVPEFRRCLRKGASQQVTAAE